MDILITNSNRDQDTAINNSLTSSLRSSFSRASSVSTTSSRLTRDEVYFMGSEELEEFCQQIFTMIDTNGDGYITEEELIAQCESDDPILVTNLIQALDTNKDGKISFEEFRQGLLTVSDQLSREREEEEIEIEQSTPKASSNGLSNGGLNGSVYYESEDTNGESEEAWISTMMRIDPNGLLTHNDDVHSMWIELYSHDHSLLEHFEAFLFNVVSDLEKSQNDVENIQNKIKKLLTEQSREAHEMDGLLQEQLMEAYDKQEKKSQEVSNRISTRYQELLDEREALIASLSEKEENLRHVLEEKTHTEQELRKERLELITLNRSLQSQLSDSYKQLSASQRQLQRISETYTDREQLPWLPGEDPLVETSILSTGSFNVDNIPPSPKDEELSLSPPSGPHPSRPHPSFNGSSLAVEVEEAMRETQTTPTEDTPTPTPTPEIEETVALLKDEPVGGVNEGIVNYSIENSLFNKGYHGDSYPAITPVHYPPSDQSLFTVSTLIPPRHQTTHSTTTTTTAPSRVFKVVILGDSGVGKTSLIRRLSSPEGELQVPRSTLGLDYSTALITLPDETVVFQLWDTAGQERFHSTTAVYFKRADAFIIVYDVCNKLTFNSIKSWISLIKTTLRADLPVLMIMGNKSDMNQRQVSREEGQRIALELGSLFSETSAMSGDNVLQAHSTLASLLLERENQDIENIRQSALRLNQLGQRKKCKC